jgi:HK97 gp10 family phage protein
MDNGIEIDGFDGLEELLQDMTVTEQDEKRAMKKALSPITDEVTKNAPSKSGRLKKSIKTSVKVEDFAVVGRVRINSFYGCFQEFGTSQQKANIGFFERSVNKSSGESINILAKELLK